MSYRRKRKSTPAPFPAGCCEFSKQDFERIRTDLDTRQLFDWVSVYEAIAPELLEYKNDRKALLDKLYKVASDPKISVFQRNLSRYEERRGDNTTRRMTDICPFSVLATFSMETPTINRWPSATALCDIFEAKIDWPKKGFHGVPNVHHANASFYMRNVSERGKGDIDALWNVFVASAEYAENESDKTRDDFIEAFNLARKVKQTQWKLTLGLYWSNPKHFPTLDRYSREYIRNHLNIPFSERFCYGGEYVVLMNRLRLCFKKGDCPINSFFELARTAREELAGEKPIGRL